MTNVTELDFNGKRYLVNDGVVSVYCESKTPWRSGWRKATSAKVIADVLRVYAEMCAKMSA